MGFEPTKRFASELESDPFDQTRVHTPMTIRFFSLPDCLGQSFLTPGETRTHNLKIRSLARYPIAPLGSPSAGLDPATYRLTAERSAN